MARLSLAKTRAIYATADGREAYRRKKEEGDHRVIEWRWATGLLFGALPFEPECFHFGRGRPLRRPPTARNAYEFGFDNGGRLCVVRRWAGEHVPADETFYEWGDDRVVSFAYNVGGVELLNTRVHLLFEGKVARAWSVAIRGDYIHRFAYQDGLVTQIRMKLSREPAERVYAIVRRGNDVVRITCKQAERESLTWTLPSNFKQEWFVRPGERREAKP